MIQETLPKKPYRGDLGQRLQHLIKATSRALKVMMMILFVGGPGRGIRWYLAQRKKSGGIVWLDHLTFGRKNTDKHHPKPDHAANISPNREITTRQSRIIKHDGYPEPDYPFAWKKPPMSGNVISGLGQPEYRRPAKVYHTMDYTTAWGGMELYLHMSNSFDTVSRLVVQQWDNRNRHGAINPVQQSVDDPNQMSKIVKSAAIDAGAVLVGITKVQDYHLYEGADNPYQYAISIAVTMEREAMLTVPEEPSRLAVMDAYIDVGRIAIHLAQQIRAIGWDARAETNNEGDSSVVVHVPVAIDAGLGELGKHGSMITKDYGSNVRLATVLTNLPLMPDNAVDIGVDDFCASCQICTTNCPPHAIFDTKQMVRGVERWHVNFDICVPYFSANGGCGICIEVCPWSAEGRGPIISQKMLERREKEQ